MTFYWCTFANNYFRIWNQQKILHLLVYPYILTYIFIEKKNFCSIFCRKYKVILPPCFCLSVERGGGGGRAMLNCVHSHTATMWTRFRPLRGTLYNSSAVGSIGQVGGMSYLQKYKCTYSHGVDFGGKILHQIYHDRPGRFLSDFQQMPLYQWSKFARKKSREHDDKSSQRTEKPSQRPIFVESWHSKFLKKFKALQCFAGHLGYWVQFWVAEVKDSLVISSL